MSSGPKADGSQVKRKFGDEKVDPLEEQNNKRRQVTTDAAHENDVRKGITKRWMSSGTASTYGLPKAEPEAAAPKRFRTYIQPYSEREKPAQEAPVTTAKRPAADEEQTGARGETGSPSKRRRVLGPVRENVPATVPSTPTAATGEEEMGAARPAVEAGVQRGANPAEDLAVAGQAHQAATVHVTAPKPEPPAAETRAAETHAAQIAKLEQQRQVTAPAPLPALPVGGSAREVELHRLSYGPAVHDVEHEYEEKLAIRAGCGHRILLSHKCRTIPGDCRMCNIRKIRAAHAGQLERMKNSYAASVANLKEVAVKSVRRPRDSAWRTEAKDLANANHFRAGPVCTPAQPTGRPKKTVRFAEEVTERRTAIYSDILDPVTETDPHRLLPPFEGSVEKPWWAFRSDRDRTRGHAPEAESRRTGFARSSREYDPGRHASEFLWKLKAENGPPSEPYWERSARHARSKVEGNRDYSDLSWQLVYEGVDLVTERTGVPFDFSKPDWAREMKAEILFGSLAEVFRTEDQQLLGYINCRRNALVF